MARALGTGTARGIETAAAFVAMTFLFSYLRRPSFMAVVYPVATGQTGELGRFTEPAMPLAVFAVSLGLLALWRRGRSLEGVLVAAGPLGSLGVALALLAQAGVLPTVWIWVSGLLCAVGFVGAVVLAGRVLCARGMLWSAGVVVVAYLVNFALFLALRQSSWLQPAVLCTPLLAASSWLLISDARMGGGVSGERSLRGVWNEPLLWLLVLLLMTCGAIRGIVGEGGSPNEVRTRVSAALALALVATWLVGLVLARGKGCGQTGASRIVLGVAVAWWLVLTVAFLAGVLFYLWVDGALGVYLVASVRATLDALWWVVLCAVARRRKVAATPFFAVWAGAAWAVLWLGGYWVVPGLLLSFGGEQGLPLVTPQAVALVAVFGLVCALVVMCAWLLVRPRGRAAWAAAEPGPFGVVGIAGAGGGTGRQDALRAAGLTEREAEVALLFAQGFSIGSVADKLGIERSTAQSHSKVIYRKLGIHTKDELIALVQGGGE